MEQSDGGSGGIARVSIHACNPCSSRPSWDISWPIALTSLVSCSESSTLALILPMSSSLAFLRSFSKPAICIDWARSLFCSWSYCDSACAFGYTVRVCAGLHSARARPHLDQCSLRVCVRHFGHCPCLHMVPKDRPRHALDMFTRFLANDGYDKVPANDAVAPLCPSA